MFKLEVELHTTSPRLFNTLMRKFGASLIRNTMAVLTIEVESIEGFKMDLRALGFEYGEYTIVNSTWINPIVPLSFDCLSCGEMVITDNEDDHVVGLCDCCLDGDYPSPYDPPSQSDYDYTCTCEDRPCCGWHCRSL